MKLDFRKFIKQDNYVDWKDKKTKSTRQKDIIMYSNKTN